MPFAGRTLRVAADASTLVIRARRGQKARLVAHRTLGGPSCQATATIDATTLDVSAKAGPGGPCGIDLELFVPPTIDLDVTLAEGTLQVSGTKGRVSATLGHVNSVIGGALRSLALTVGEGSASLQGLEGDANIRIDAGNLQIFYASGAHGTLHLQLQAGNATVLADQAVRVDATTPSPAHLSNTTALDGALSGERLQIEGEVIGRLTVRRSGH